jgi:hypothetical protein
MAKGEKLTNTLKLTAKITKTPVMVIRVPEGEPTNVEEAFPLMEEEFFDDLQVTIMVPSGREHKWSYMPISSNSEIKIEDLIKALADMVLLDLIKLNIYIEGTLIAEAIKSALAKQKAKSS